MNFLLENQAPSQSQTHLLGWFGKFLLEGGGSGHGLFSLTKSLGLAFSFEVSPPGGGGFHCLEHKPSGFLWLREKGIVYKPCGF